MDRYNVKIFCKFEAGLDEKRFLLVGLIMSMSVNNKGEQSRICEMRNTTLKQVNQEKDIGVIVNEQLKFKSHVYEKIHRTNNMM